MRIIVSKTKPDALCPRCNSDEYLVLSVKEMSVYEKEILCECLKCHRRWIEVDRGFGDLTWKEGTVK